MNPIRIIDWQLGFLPELAAFLTDRHGSALGDAVVIFPHNRPKRYLRAALAALPGLQRPLVTPRMHSVSELAAPAGLRGPRSLNLLDRTALLFDIAVRVRAGTTGLLSRLPLDHERFFPWGVRLAGLLEEFLRQGLVPSNLIHMQGEVVDWAAALLEHLGVLFEKYVEALEAQGLTTPGLDAMALAREPGRLVSAFAGRPVFIAGFYALSGAEDAVFRALWERADAEIVWHSDPALAESGPAHFAAVEHAAWARRWSARTEVLARAKSRSGPEIRFHEGFNLHSQLIALKEELERSDPAGTRAVVLPDTSLLMPVLHHLPETDLNISMGYPLDRTSLARLLDLTARLQAGRAESGKYHWRDLTGLVRHPWLKALSPDGEHTLAPVMHQWERHIREEGPFVSPDDFLPAHPEDTPPALARGLDDLRRKVVLRFIRAFENVRTLGELAIAFGEAAALLEEYGASLWHTHLLDAECLVRLKQNVLPEMSRSGLRDAPLSASTLFSVFAQILEAERVSFEPEPLTGLQVLGMLETRLLGFHSLFVLDAVEDKLPGTSPHDPLLPDPMRALLGLPDSGERDNVAAYNFHRLIQGADQAVILYQSGVKPGVLDSKSVRSRYVEQLLWEEEKRRGEIIRPGDAPPLQAVRFPLSTAPVEPRPVAASPAVLSALDRRLRRGLSPSALDVYLTCPKKFFYAHLTRLAPPDSVNEEGDLGEIGTLVHAVLEDFFRPFLNTPTDFSKVDPELLAQAFSDRLRREPLFGRLGFDRARALEAAGRERLRRFMAQGTKTEILALETRLRGMVQAEGLDVDLVGKLDRVDRRTEGVIILDYKTGTVKTPTKRAWEDEGFWDEVASGAPDPDITAELAERFPSLQLPVYTFLYATTPGNALPADAAWVDLADKGGEIPLFGDLLDPDEQRQAALVKTPAMVRYLIRCMLKSQAFDPRPDGIANGATGSRPAGPERKTKRKRKGGMEYSEGRIGRVFVVRLGDGDRLPDCVERFAAEKNVRRAVCTLVGGVGGGSRESRIVSGPEDGAARPPQPMVRELQGVHEILAAGTIFPDKAGTPRLHMHAACGRDDQTRMGCVRPGVEVWTIGELTVLEILDAEDMVRQKDPDTGFELLTKIGAA